MLMKHSLPQEHTYRPTLRNRALVAQNTLQRKYLNCILLMPQEILSGERTLSVHLYPGAPNGAIFQPHLKSDLLGKSRPRTDSAPSAASLRTVFHPFSHEGTHYIWSLGWLPPTVHSCLITWGKNPLASFNYEQVYSLPRPLAQGSQIGLPPLIDRYNGSSPLDLPPTALGIPLFSTLLRPLPSPPRPTTCPGQPKQRCCRKYWQFRYLLGQCRYYFPRPEDLLNNKVKGFLWKKIQL